MAMPNPYSPDEEQYYKELAVKVGYHLDTMSKCDQQIFPYKEWREMVRTTGVVGPNPYPPKAEEEIKALEEQWQYHYAEMGKYDRELRHYRDMKNAIHCAYHDGLKKVYRETISLGLQGEAVELVRRSLRDGLPIDHIALATGLSEEAITTLQKEMAAENQDA